MSDENTIVIVGASLAGAKAAEALRADGFTGRVLLRGEEPERPYERPPLSKGYLRGEEGSDKVFVHDETFYDSVGIELRLSCRVEGIVPAERRVTLAGGECIAYDRLLLTTGAAPRRLRLAGADLAGVHYLRTIGDSDDLREAIQAGGRIVVIGGGWIGCEVAASARQLGAEVAMVEVAELPLKHVLGPELGAFYRDVHADAGVELHLGIGVEALRGSGSVEEKSSSSAAPRWPPRWWWSASGCPRAPNSPKQPDSHSTTALSPTNAWPPALRGSMRPVTWPRRGIRCWDVGFAWNTGPRRSTRGGWLRRTWRQTSAAPKTGDRTLRSPTFSPINTGARRCAPGKRFGGQANDASSSPRWLGRHRRLSDADMFHRRSGDAGECAIIRDSVRHSCGSVSLCCRLPQPPVAHRSVRVVAPHCCRWHTVCLTAVRHPRSLNVKRRFVDLDCGTARRWLRRRACGS